MSNHGARIETFEVAGETLITTPAQTVIEQKMAEGEGLRERMTGGELAGQVGRAMQVAAAQSLFMGGGPVAVEGAVRGVSGGFRKAPQVVAAWRPEDKNGKVPITPETVESYDFVESAPGEVRW